MCIRALCESVRVHGKELFRPPHQKIAYAHSTIYYAQISVLTKFRCACLLFFVGAAINNIPRFARNQ
jgi:hypothetical protein